MTVETAPDALRRPAPNVGAARATRAQRREVNTLPFVAPSVGVLLVWMIIPLVLTLWFSFRFYNLLDPTRTGFAGLLNYRYLIGEADFWASLINTLVLIGSVLVITVVGGTLIAVLFDEPFPGRSIARVLVISPFFIMPTVAALVWKNLMLHPIYGVIADFTSLFGLGPISVFSQFPMPGIILIVSWEWLPFAALILLTAIQSLDHEQKEAARMDGAGVIGIFRHVTLPHLSRPIGVVVMIETIFLLTVFAEIYVTTSGGPGDATTNLAFLIYEKALLRFDVGGASAGGVVAIILANIVAFFLARSVARNLET